MPTDSITAAHRAGKANPARWPEAVKILRAQSLRKRSGLPVNATVSYLAWGTIMAGAQAIDPRVDHRYAAITALGLSRSDLYG